MWKTKVMSLSLPPETISNLKEIKSFLSKTPYIKSKITISDIIRVLVNYMIIDKKLQNYVASRCIEEAVNADERRKWKKNIFEKFTGKKAVKL